MTFDLKKGRPGKKDCRFRQCGSLMYVCIIFLIILILFLFNNYYSVAYEYVDSTRVKRKKPCM